MHSTIPVISVRQIMKKSPNYINVVTTSDYEPTEVTEIKFYNKHESMGYTLVYLTVSVNLNFA